MTHIRAILSRFPCRAVAFDIVRQTPSLSDINVGFDTSDVAHFPWLLMASSALALAVLASLDTLLTSVVADVATGTRHHAKRELIGQGAGHVLSAFFGGMAGAGTTGATLVAIQSGGRMWVGLMTGLCMLILILLMGPVAAILPISVFAGIILHVAIFGMLDKDIFRWLKFKQARIDGLIACIVTVVTVSYDLMIAVGLGVVLAVIEFIRAQVQSAVVQRRWHGGERKSIRGRPKAELKCLHEHAQSIVGYELKGTLFFGTTDHLLDALQNDLQRASYILLDMRHVGQVDLTAVRLIEHMSGTMRQRGGELILAQAPTSMGLVKKEGHRHERLIPYHENVRLRTFADIDRALEYAENRVLESFNQHTVSAGEALPLAKSELMKLFSGREQQLLMPYFEIMPVDKGDYMFKSGEFGEALYVILSGELEVLLPFQGRKKMRLAIFGPGMTVGELAFLEPGPRAADGRMIQTGEVAVFHHVSLQALGQQHPTLALALLLRLGKNIGESLGKADEELRRMAI